jgi:hypothetical protein
MSADSVYTRTMRSAVEAIGDPAQLAKVLGASAGEIEAWVKGHAVPPPGVFLRAIDLLSQHGWNSRGPSAS